MSFQSELSGVASVTVMPRLPSSPAIEASIVTAKVCSTPIRSEAMKAPTSDPMPPTTATTNTIDPTAAAIDGSVTNALPPMTPARPASAAPPPKTIIKTRGTLWPRASTISGWVNAAWITRPMRVRVSTR